jgi:hypothetical protein
MFEGTNSSKGLVLQKQSLKEVVLSISVLIHKFEWLATLASRASLASPPGPQCNIYMQRNQPTIYVNTASIKKKKLTPLLI